VDTGLYKILVEIGLMCCYSEWKAMNDFLLGRSNLRVLLHLDLKQLLKKVEKKRLE
jgi:hypothetical protein